MIANLLDGILRIPVPLAVALVFALPFLEASIFLGVVVPGEIGVFFGGVLANQHKVSLTVVLIAGIAGAILGDNVGYALGHRYGERLLRRIPRRLVKQESLERGQVMIRRLGGRAVFVGRFTAALRALVPGLAGTAHMPYGRFLVFNMAGGLLWAGGFVLLGYVAGSQYQRVERNASYVGYALLAVIVAAGIVVLLRRRRAAARS